MAFFETVELGDRLLAVVGDDRPLGRIVAVDKVGRERIDPGLQRIDQYLAVGDFLLRAGQAIAPVFLVPLTAVRRRLSAT